MDPLKRKLFQSRDARNKLREQGGIMASSPELAQTVAKFANGGPTELQIPRVRSAIQEGGMSYPSYRMLSGRQKRELGYPESEIGGQFAFDRFSVGLGLVDPTDRFSPSGLNVSRRVPVPLESEEFLTPEGRGRTRQIVVGNMPYLFDPVSGRVFRVDGSAVTPQEQARVTELMGSPEVQDQINAPEAATRQSRERDVQRAQDRYDAATEGNLAGSSTEIGEASRALAEAQRRLNNPTSPAPIPAETEAVPLTDTGVQEPETPVSGNMAEAIRLMTGDDAYSGPDESPVAPEDDTDKTPPKKDDPRTTLDEARKVVESEEFDFDTSYEKAVERFGRILGDESNEDRRKKALANMAMIGLAIAAGQSPDALTNIAQGALVGLKGIQEAEAADKQSAKEVRLAALKATMDRETRIREAEAEAAKGKLEFGRKLTLEEAKARLRAKYGDGSGGRNARALPDFVQNVFSKALEAAQSGTAVDMVEGENPISYATRVADRAALDQQIRFPDTYGTSPQVKAMVDSQLKSNKSKEQVRAMLLEVFPNIDPSLYGL